MAQLIMRGKVWYARYQKDGKDVWCSTHTGDRRRAEAVLKRTIADAHGKTAIPDAMASLLAAFTHEEVAAAGDTQKLAELKAQRQRSAAALLAGTPDRITLEDAWDAWLASPKKRQPSDGTIESYRPAWTRFQKWAKAAPIQHLSEVTPAQAQRYAADLYSEGLASRTTAGQLKFLRSLFARLRIQAGLVENPWKDVVVPEIQQESRRALTAKELKSVGELAQGNMRGLILVGLLTGLRLGDAVQLRWSSVDLKRNVLDVMPGKTAYKRKRVQIPIAAPLAQFLRNQRITSRKEVFVFPKEAAQYQHNRTSVSRKFQTLFVAAGITTTEKIRGRKRVVVKVGFHSLRHSFVSICAAAGTPQHVLQSLVGHGSPAMTEIYTHTDMDQKRQAVAGLPGLLPAS